MSSTNRYLLPKITKTSCDVYYAWWAYTRGLTTPLRKKTVGISGLHNPPTADKIFPIRFIKGVLVAVAQLHNYVCSRNISYIFTYFALRAIFGSKYRLVLLQTT